jgi:hypothetical protein
MHVCVQLCGIETFEKEELMGISTPDAMDHRQQVRPYVCVGT